jgi:hypothetical protein
MVFLGVSYYYVLVFGRPPTSIKLRLGWNTPESVSRSCRLLVHVPCFHFIFNFSHFPFFSLSIFSISFFFTFPFHFVQIHPFGCVCACQDFYSLEEVGRMSEAEVVAGLTNHLLDAQTLIHQRKAQRVPGDEPAWDIGRNINAAAAVADNAANSKVMHVHS